MSEYEIKEIPTNEFGELWVDYGKQFFEKESQIFRLRDALNQNDLEKLKELESYMGNPIRINLALYQHGDFIGWSWGYQESASKFYICNSAILPEYRGRGLYTKLLTCMIDKVTQLGFQEVYSKHTTANNRVIVPKLKYGFVITGLEISDLFGSLVHLSYYPSEIRNKMYNYRVGKTKPDQEIKRYLDI